MKRLRFVTTPAALMIFFPVCGKDTAPPRDLEVHAGKTSFEAYCSACHDPEGTGVKGGGPPLAASPWVSGPEEWLIRIVLHGLHGPLQVGGETYNLEMPGFGSVLDDAQVGVVVSFVRRRFGGLSAPVTPAAVGRVRAAERERDGYWSAEELLRVR